MSDEDDIINIRRPSAGGGGTRANRRPPSDDSPSWLGASVRGGTQATAYRFLR